MMILVSMYYELASPRFLQSNLNIYGYYNTHITGEKN